MVLLHVLFEQFYIFRGFSFMYGTIKVVFPCVISQNCFANLKI